MTKFPLKSTLSRILNTLLCDEINNGEQFRLHPSRDEEIYKALFNWSCYQQETRVVIACYLIQRKGLQLQALINEKPPEYHIIS